MSLLFDGIMLLVAILSIVMAAKNGFIKSIMGMCTFILSILIAYTLTPTVAPYIQSSDFVKNAAESLAETIDSMTNAGLANYPLDSIIASVLAFVALFILSVIILKIATWLLDLFFQLPILKTANTMLGILVGIINAILWVSLLASVSIFFIHTLTSVAPEYFNESVIENSFVLNFYSNFKLEDILQYIPYNS